MNKTTKTCERCNGGYATGKYYGEHWSLFPSVVNGEQVSPKGLCEFCNPKSIWFVGNRDIITKNLNSTSNETN